MDRAPATPVLVAGAFGGPFVIFLCTPLRNALTLGAQDRRSGIRLLLGKAFRGGPAAGWTGGRAPAVVACPQFLALGPIYHALHSAFRGALGVRDGGHALLPSAGAAVGAGLVETLLTFGSQSRNAQMAYNNSMVAFSSIQDGARIRVPLNKTYQVWGSGAGAMLSRNMLSAASVRTLSPWVQERVSLPGAGKAAQAVLCDVGCSVCVCTLTAPLNQLFNYMATTPQAKTAPSAERWSMAWQFVQKQYFVPLPRSREDPSEPRRYSWRVSGIAARDFAMRTMYVTTVFTLYMSIERTLCAAMAR